MKTSFRPYTRCLFLLSLFPFLLSFAQPRYEEGRTYRHQLENGLTVLTMERHVAPLVYHQLTYRVGSRNERLGITGISHVVEHMMFKGTPRYGKGETSRLISRNAGIFNAFTANDMTSYFEYLPSNKIDLALDIESDRMQNCVFDPKEFTSEVEVIKQERRMRSESTPQGVLQETMNAVAYDSHPNRDPIIGWPSDLARVTRDEAFSYYRTYYTPNNAFLVLVGDFDTNAMLEKVKKYYGSIPRGPVVQDLVAQEQPQRVRKTFTIYHNDITSPSVRFSFHVPTYADSDAAALRLAAMVLCERSREARLYKRLVEKARIATSAMGGMPMAKDPPLFSMSVSVVPDSSLERVEAMVWDEIKTMQDVQVPDHELQKVKNRYRFSQVTNYVKNADIGGRISRYEAFFGWDSLPVFDKRMREVKAADIQRVMKAYFNPWQATLGYLLPKEGGKKRPVKPQTEEQGDGDEGRQETHLQDALPWVFYYYSPEAEIDRPGATASAPDQFVPPKPIAPQVRKMKLDNGMECYTIENHLVPALFVGGLIETGLIPEADSGGKPGIAAVLTETMNRGTADLRYDEFAERLAFVPFSFSASGSYRSFSFQGYALVENADEMLRTGFDLVTRPGLRDEDIAVVKRRGVISARERFKKTSVRAFYHMFNTLFHDHPFARANSTEGSITAITRDDLVALHRKYFRPDRVTLVMMGDMTPDQMRILANRSFGRWKSSGTPPPILPIPAAPALTGKEIKVFPEKDYTECTINLGFLPASDIAPADEEAVTCLNSILAASALTSRMGVELRDKQGLIYGIKSELWSPSDHIGYWKFNTKTAPKNAVRVISGIFSEIRKLQDGGITPDELQTAKDRQLGLLPLFVETPDDVANRVFELLRNKQPLDWFDKKAERILAVTSDDVLRAARKYLTLDRYRVVVDGPLEEGALNDIAK
jgi:zinc protease